MTVATQTTLVSHLTGEIRCDPRLDSDLAAVLSALALAGEKLSRRIRRAALTGEVGLSGEQNSTGDCQKKLDVLGNEIFLDLLSQTGLVAAVAGEELERAVWLNRGPAAKLIVCVDPVDGSSNTDINGSLGTIFGIYPRKGSGADEEAEFRRRGSEQIAAGYIMYSTSTMFVYAAARGVHGFTFDQDLGEFVLSHPNLRCPAKGRTYSTNLARYSEWDSSIRRLADFINSRGQAADRPYSLRYTGALVADFHRCLLEGGFYLYPADTNHPNGKLRLLYECAPLAFVVEQAGGRATTGTQRILDVPAAEIHQRAPLVIGSTDDVSLFDEQPVSARPGHAGAMPNTALPQSNSIAKTMATSRAR